MKSDNHGGARERAGRKAVDGAVGLVCTSVKLTPEQKAFVAKRGGSAYIRLMISVEMEIVRVQDESGLVVRM